MTAPLVSVIIVNWNTRDLLAGCLRSLPWSSPAFRLEAIVVDNGSTDGSPEMVAREFPRVRLFAQGENLGFVRANNLGLAAATGDFLFMLNSDTEVRAGAIERLLEALQGDPRIGAVGPRLLNSDGSIQPSAGAFPRLLSRLLPGLLETRYERRLQGLAEERALVPVDWLGGAALMTRRDVLQRVGPLDERYYMWYDDLDWAQKLRRAGYARVFVGGAEVVHHGRQSGRKLQDRDLAAQLFDSEYTYLRLHHGLAVTWATFGLRVGKALARRAFGGKEARQEAAWRLSYHSRRFSRFCLRPIPAAGTPADTDTAPGPFSPPRSPR